MASLALISKDAGLHRQLVDALAGSKWSVVAFGQDGGAQPTGIAQDIVVIDANHPATTEWEGPRGVPLLLVLEPGQSSPRSDELVDEIVYRHAPTSEWIARLNRLLTLRPIENLRRQYVETLASMAPGVVVVGPDLKMVFANPRAYQIVGHREDSIETGDLSDIIAEDDRRRIADALARREYPRGMAIRAIRREGREIECMASFAPLIGAEDHTVVSFDDVTHERETELELLKTMQFLESLIDASVDAIIATDIDQRIVLFNPSAERITGRHVSDAMATLTLEDLLGRPSAELVMQRLVLDDYGGEGRLEPTLLELTNIHGDPIPVQLSASLIYEDSNPSAIVLIFTDLRERVRMEERLADAQKRLAFTDKQGVLAELAGTAAHELNQPLTSMMAYAELLLRQSEEGSVGEKSAQVLIREAERMAEIVRKIGKITKYETTSYVGHQKIFDLDRAADSSTSDPGREP